MVGKHSSDATTIIVPYEAFPERDGKGKKDGLEGAETDEPVKVFDGPAAVGEVSLVADVAKAVEIVLVTGLLDRLDGLTRERTSTVKVPSP